MRTPIPFVEFRLPWSDTYRDLYGITHAYYIYTLLARYYTRILEGVSADLRLSRDRDHASQRFGEIIAGLTEARAATFDPHVDRFTETGREALRLIGEEISRLDKWGIESRVVGVSPASA